MSKRKRDSRYCWLLLFKLIVNEHLITIIIMQNPEEPFFNVETLNNTFDRELTKRSDSKPLRYYLVLCIPEYRNTIQIDKIFNKLRQRVLFCSPSTNLNLDKIAGKVEGYVISFDEVFLNLLNGDYGEKNYVSVFTALAESKSIQIDDDIFAYLYQISNKLEFEFQNPGSFRFDLLMLYVKLFLIHLERCVYPVTEGTPANIQNKLTADFISAVQKNFRKIKKVTIYADKLSVSPNHLNEVVKKHTGHSAHYHIQQRIIMEAKCKAVNSDIHMKEIAYQLGFESTSHFSKYFRNASGINFTVFKRNNYLSI